MILHQLNLTKECTWWYQSLIRETLISLHISMMRSYWCVIMIVHDRLLLFDAVYKAQGMRSVVRPLLASLSAGRQRHQTHTTVSRASLGNFQLYLTYYHSSSISQYQPQPGLHSNKDNMKITTFITFLLTLALTAVVQAAPVKRDDTDCEARWKPCNQVWASKSQWGDC